MPRRNRPGRDRAPATGQRAFPFPDGDPADDHFRAGPAAPPPRRSPRPADPGAIAGYDPATALLTRSGWRPIAAVTTEDEVAALDPASGALAYRRPTRRHAHHYEGPMYHLGTKHLDILAAPAQRLWVARPGQAYRGVRADAFHASRNEWQFRKDCTWAGVERPWMEFEPFERYTSRTQYLPRMPMDDWLEFLGYYLAEGRVCVKAGGGLQAQVSQFRSSPAWPRIDAALARLGLRYSYREQSNRFEVHSAWLHGVLAPLGDAYAKHVPAYVQDLAPRQLRILLDAYLAGDGHLGACWEFGSSSVRLAEDIQVVCLKLGWSVSLRRTERSDNWQKRPHWRGRINRGHLRPWWKKGRLRAYPSLREGLVPYAGEVYGVEVPGGVVHCRRNDRTYWSGDSRS